jgi:hypothetical protein
MRSLEEWLRMRLSWEWQILRAALDIWVVTVLKSADQPTRFSSSRAFR